MLVSLRSQSVKLIAHLKSSTEESVIIVRYLALKKIFFLSNVGLNFLTTLVGS